jgi:hypothetical protein
VNQGYQIYTPIPQRQSIELSEAILGSLTAFFNNVLSHGHYYMTACGNG